MIDSCSGVFLLCIGAIPGYPVMHQVLTIRLQADANEEESSFM